MSLTFDFPNWHVGIGEQQQQQPDGQQQQQQQQEQLQQEQWAADLQVRGKLRMQPHVLLMQITAELLFLTT
jgi:hypothetical protein